MTTISQRQDKAYTILDTLEEELTDHDEWSSVGNDISNDQESDEWHDNAIALHNDEADVYVTLYFDDDQNFNRDDSSKTFSGIRLVVSEDWDEEEDVPAGKSDLIDADGPYDSDLIDDGVQIERVDSYTNVSTNIGDTGIGIWFGEGGVGDDRQDLAESAELQYFGSARSDGFTLAVWSTEDSDNGAAAYITFEVLEGRKFWSDGTVGFAANSCSSAGDLNSDRTQSSIYGFRWVSESNSDNQSITEQPGHPQGTGDGRWGRVNTNSDDDTFFFIKESWFYTRSENNPVAWMEGAIRNDRDEGAAHGDIVSYDDQEYRCLRQSGAGTGSTITCLLRYD